MIIPFDIDTAKLALEAGTGVLVTRDGKVVKEILSWEDPIDPEFPIRGKCFSSSPDLENIEYTWSNTGRWSIGAGYSNLDFLILPIIDMS